MQDRLRYCYVSNVCPKSVTVAKRGVKSVRYLENLIRNGGVHNFDIGIRSVSEKSLQTP